MKNNNHKYEIIIYWDNQDLIYIAEVPELAGCMAHGKTYDHALTHVKAAIDLWIDTAKEFGHVVPKPKGERLMFA